MMDTGEPKGNFSIINLCQFLYVTTSGSKIGARNLIRQLGYEQSLQCLDPDHLPFLDDENLACLLTDCSFQPSPSHAILLAGAKSALEVLGRNSHPQKYSLLVPSKLYVRCWFLFPSEWSLCSWHGCGETHISIPLGKFPCVTVTGRYTRTPRLFPGGTAGVGKAMQEERGGFMASASSFAHLDKAGSNQPFISPGHCLSSHKTWIEITFQRDWENIPQIERDLFGNAYKMPWLKGRVERQCFDKLLLVLEMCGGKGLLQET